MSNLRSHDPLAHDGLADALRLADDVTPAPAVAAGALEVLRNALASACGMTVAELQYQADARKMSAGDRGSGKWMKAWPVDFAGFTDAGAIIDRIEVLVPQVRTGSEDLCWAAWEIEQLEHLLFVEDLNNRASANDPNCEKA